MKIVIGIGNPGREYAETRHNVGFRVVDRVGALLSGSGAGSGAGSGGSSGRGADSFRSRRKFKCVMADLRARLGGPGAGDEERVLLVKPETFVNLSGECVRAVVDYFGLQVDGVDSLLVVSDDVNLPLGRLRVRPSGSSGGHNGIESVIRHLGTAEFPRLRVGVGPPGVPLTRHVLGPFGSEERPVAEQAEARAAEAVLEWARNGVEACMNLFNRAPEEGG